MKEVAGPQEVHRVHSRSARRPDMSGSHSRSISDPIRSSWFLPSLEYSGLHLCFENLDHIWILLP